ncbi:MAG: thioredoxin family protein [Nitrospinae bacterium]|nr:thioredoxin family protein [Nitrospinota bacterium]
MSSSPVFLSGGFLRQVPFLIAALLAGMLSWFPAPAVPGAEAAGLPLPEGKPPGWEGWYAASPEEGTKIHLYFFWSGKCPHCLRAKPFVESLRSAYPWLAVHSLELGESRENAELYLKIASALGEKAKSVPAFLFCERLHAGYDDERNAGVFLKNQLLVCRQNLLANVSSGSGKPLPDAGKTPLVLPFMGQIDPSALSLPALPLIVAGMDAFNPCAFFVLLFLLSLLVHTRSRAKMAFIGGTFVLFSGLVYFIFMAAWLNVFLLMGELKAVTVLAGAVAATLALVNIKDYFFFGKGPSLSIPENGESETETTRVPLAGEGRPQIAREN